MDVMRPVLAEQSGVNHGRSLTLRSCMCASFPFGMPKTETASIFSWISRESM